MTSARTLSTFTSTGTEANKTRATAGQTKKPRDDYRVIFADKVRYHQDKVWDRDHEGGIKIGKEGGQMYTMVKDYERMTGAPRKIFDSEHEYHRWQAHRELFQELEDVDLEEEEQVIEDLNSDLIRE